MEIHLYKTSTPSTRNGTVDSQVKSNPRNNLIYGQHHCGKGRNARGIIPAWHRGEVISIYTRYSNMEKTKLFQAPTEPEAPLLSKRRERIIHISFDGQRRIES
ncbi:hypothetical protein R6Q57_019989 [Mikania cordata]